MTLRYQAFVPSPQEGKTTTNCIFLLLVNIPDLSQFLMPRMQLHNVQSGMQLQQQFSAKTIKFIVMLDISIDCNSQICFHSAQHDNMMVVGKVLLPLPPQILQAWQLVLHNDSCQNKNCRNTLSSRVGARGIGLKIYRE